MCICMLAETSKISANGELGHLQFSTTLELAALDSKISRYSLKYVLIYYAAENAISNAVIGYILC